jgi:hypothetical protein
MNFYFGLYKIINIAWTQWKNGTTDGPKNCLSGRQQRGGGENGHLDGWWESIMQWHRYDWKKGSGWLEKKGTWKSDNVRTLIKWYTARIHTHTKPSVNQNIWGEGWVRKADKSSVLRAVAYGHWHAEIVWRIIWEIKYFIQLAIWKEMCVLSL